jgi:hypothetical protein
MIKHFFQLIKSSILTIYNSKGGPIFGGLTTVMALTGHKDIRMLQRYSHTREEAKKIAINKLSKNLFAERNIHIQPS